MVRPIITIARDPLRGHKVFVWEEGEEEEEENHTPTNSRGANPSIL